MAARRGAQLAVGAEVALAFGCGLAVFALLAVPLVAADSSLLPVIALALAGIGAAIAILRTLGIAYAVTAVTAGLLAFDWYYVPPTHPHAFPDAESLANLLLFIAAGALIGVLAANAGRRADTSELARSELASEQAALRRVATLVAEGVPATRLFAAVAEEAARLLGVDGAWIEFYEGEDVVKAAEWSRPGMDPPTFNRAKVEDAPVAAAVRRSGGVVRVDDFESVQPTTRFADQPKMMSLVGAPITVDRGQWGVMLAWSRDRPLPDDAEEHLTAFTELVATAIADSDARIEVARLADEQAALRRVATLVAEGGPPPEVFAAVAREVGELLGVDSTHIGRFGSDGTATGVGSWSADGTHLSVGTVAPLDGTSITAMVYESGRPERLDSYEGSSGEIAGITRELGIRCSVGAPIVVDGQPWGVIVASSRDPSPLPPDAESRIAGFTELAATAISNTEARIEVNRLADQQAALRRVATLVAREVSPEELFSTVCDEVERLLGIEEVDMVRVEGDGTFTVLSFGGREVGEFPVGNRLAIEGRNAISLVVETERPARIDDYSTATGPMGEIAKSAGVRGVVGCPIVVQGRLWGVAVAATRREDPLPADSESRIGEFTELVATAIANAEARREVATLAEEQAALRRVATLVAEGVPPPEVFAAVARELGQLLGVDSTHLARYEPDGMVTVVGSWSPDGNNAPVGTRVPLDDTTVTGLVHESGRPARLDGYGHGSREVREIVESLGIRSSAGAPITVDGQPWGVMIASSKGPEPLAGGTEVRIAAFSELVATAISNTEARSETRRLAEAQAALRRVATLVARGVPPTELFDAVAAEVGSLLDADLATLFRYEDDDLVKMLSIWTADGVSLETPETWGVEELGLSRSTATDNWPGRVDDWTQFSGPLAQFVREDARVTSSVSSPILVEGRLWGALAVHSRQVEPLPADSEVRVGEFTGLVATAISNVQAREDLAASRARIVAATDEERRRVVRDLHDGAQQRLVHTIVTLKMASRVLEHESEKEAFPLVTEALQHAEEATGELRELAHGILPSVLTQGGLRAGVAALASRMPVAVENAVSVDRLPPTVEATAYFIVAEALTNVAKHSRAGHAVVTAETGNGTLHIQVRDDGVGGARASGTGLVGLADRVSAHDGTLRLESPADGGTLVAAEIPVPQRE